MPSQLSGVPISLLCVSLEPAFPSSSSTAATQSSWISRQQPLQLQTLPIGWSILSPVILKAQLSLSHAMNLKRCPMVYHKFCSFRSSIVCPSFPTMSSLLFSSLPPHSPNAGSSPRLCTFTGTFHLTSFLSCLSQPAHLFNLLKLVFLPGFLLSLWKVPQNLVFNLAFWQSHLILCPL